MAQDNRRLFLLGPQPHFESLKLTIGRIELRAPVALITAGWETEELEDAELKQAIGGPVVNLGLFARTEQLFKEDPELIQLLRDRQDELRLVRDAYNERLDFLLGAARQTLRYEDSVVEFSGERESAIEMVRQLDRQYFVRTSQIIDAYEERLQTPARPLVARHREEIDSVLQHSSAIFIAGGHVAIILNRLRIFGILDMCCELPIVAWSGGAMALSDQIILFHDSPPQGRGNPELLRAGMGEFHNFLPLPDARHRLQLEDKTRVELFARRFADYRCLLLQELTILERSAGQWQSVGPEPATCLGASGEVVDFSA